MANADPRSPATVDELLEFIVSKVTSHYSATMSPTNGAFLADAIRREYPDFSYENLGITKLADAIAAAEARRLLIRNRAVKHLEVLPPNAALPTPFAISPSAVRHIHVREDAWRAFAYVAQPGVTWNYDRRTAKIIHSAEIKENGDKSTYVKIHPIPLDQQKQWMAEFVSTKHGLDIRSAPINDARCFSAFPLWLAQHYQGLDREWRLFRVQRVSDYVREWCATNDISENQFFEDAHPRSVNPRRTSVPSIREQAIRAAIVDAVNELPLEALGEFCVPIRYILRHLQNG